MRCIINTLMSGNKMKFTADLLIKAAQKGFKGMSHKVIDPFVIQIGESQTIGKQNGT